MPYASRDFTHDNRKIKGYLSSMKKKNALRLGERFFFAESRGYIFEIFSMREYASATNASGSTPGYGWEETSSISEPR